MSVGSLAGRGPRLLQWRHEKGGGGEEATRDVETEEIELASLSGGDARRK